MGADGLSSTTPTPTPITTSELKGYYASAGGQSTSAADIVRVLDAILNRDSSEDLTVSDIKTSLTALRDVVTVNTNEIEYLHKLIGLLIFECVEQGIKIENEELIEQLNYIQ